MSENVSCRLSVDLGGTGFVFRVLRGLYQPKHLNPDLDLRFPRTAFTKDAKCA